MCFILSNGWTGVSLAQSNISISGTVSDSTSSLPIEGASVQVLSGDCSAITDAAGRFVLRAIPPGPVMVQVQRFGYRPSAPLLVEVKEGFEQHLRVSLAPFPVPVDGQQVVACPDGEDARAAARRLTQVEIAREGHRTVAEALAAIPGVQLYGGNETPGGTRVSVAGQSPLRVAVLFDGLPLATGPDGAVDLDAIPLSAVTAIEVHPGSQRPSTGGSAIGGTVNILTRSRTAVAKRRAVMSSGADGEFLGSAAGRQSLPGVSSDWSLEHAGRGDTYRYPSGDSSVERTGVGMSSWRSYLALTSAAVSSLQVSGFWYHADVGLPGALQQSTPNATNETARLRAQAVWTRSTESIVNVSAGVWYELSNEHFRSPERLVADDEWDERFIGGRASVSTRIAGLGARAELEAREQYLDGTNHQRPHLSFGRRTVTECAARAVIRRDSDVGSHRFTISAAGDLDAGDLGSPFYSPHLDVAWSSPFGLRARAGWGRSFRRPLLTSLFWKADAYAVGDPTLRPERSTEWDAAVGFSGGTIEADIRYFERRVDDIITWQRSTVTGQYKPLNIDRSILIGREDHAALRFGERALVVEYIHVFTSAHDRSSDFNYNGQTLVLTPRHTHEGVVSSELGRWHGRLSGRWVSLRYIRRQNDPGKVLRPYRVFDGRLSCTLRRGSPAIDLALGIENIGDEYYELLERYPASGRGWSAATTITF